MHNVARAAVVDEAASGGAAKAAVASGDAAVGAEVAAGPNVRGRRDRAQHQPTPPATRSRS